MTQEYVKAVGRWCSIKDLRTCNYHMRLYFKVDFQEILWLLLSQQCCAVLCCHSSAVLDNLRATAWAQIDTALATAFLITFLASKHLKGRVDPSFKKVMK